MAETEAQEVNGRNQEETQAYFQRILKKTREENRAHLDFMIDGHPVSEDSPEVMRTGLYFVGGRGVLIVTADGPECNDRLGLIQKAVEALAHARM